MSCGNPHETPCAEVDAHLDEYLDRELSATEVVLLEVHFRECPPCRAQLKLAILMQRLVARSCAGSAPVELRQRVLRRITEIRGNGMRITVEQTQIIDE